jgi:hypothetical protein
LCSNERGRGAQNGVDVSLIRKFLTLEEMLRCGPGHPFQLDRVFRKIRETTIRLVGLVKADLVVLAQFDPQ